MIALAPFAFILDLKREIIIFWGRMFVCICRAVTEHQVGVAIASGATTVEAVSNACRAGGDCGACHGTIEAMIDEHCERRRGSAVRLPLVDDRERAA